MGILVSVVLPLGLAFIMFSLGLGLTIKDFVRVGQQPLAFLVGAFSQIILLPIVTYFLVVSFGIKAEIAVGFMILASCPGGVTSNIITRMAKGDVALSVSLTAVISIVSMITVPIILGFSLSTFMGESAPQISIMSASMAVFALTVVPIVIGMTLKSLFSTAMIRSEPIISKIAVALFVIIVIAAVAANWTLFVENFWLLGPATATLVAVLSVAGYFMARLLGRSQIEAKTISIETGVQNGTLGIAVAAIIVGGGVGMSAYALPSAIYSIVMYLVVLPIVFVYRRMG
ncbi:bile acid:sodium symporter family protein [Ahrensia kielensis]|uniref:Bile acid:sodium symporter family protein n=1 Tax=Ahrensia kielensis TaxID=76980 RepID=A0ABU9T991_9HYPH